MFLTDLVVIGQPLVAHGMGSKDVDNPYVCRLGRITNQTLWFRQPHFRFTAPATPLAK
jgi:hypothetical protein